MAELKERNRKHIAKKNFAYVDKSGEGHLPIHDKAHARNALARFNQTDFESAEDKERARRKVVAAAKKFGVEVSSDDNVKKKPATRRRRRDG